MGSCPPFEFSSKYYHYEISDGCMRQSSFFHGKAVLNQAVGYSIILGFGAFFAVFTSFLVISLSLSLSLSRWGLVGFVLA